MDIPVSKCRKLRKSFSGPATWFFIRIWILTIFLRLTGS
jgi:hypothetical protein